MLARTPPEDLPIRRRPMRRGSILSPQARAVLILVAASALAGAGAALVVFITGGAS